MSEIAERIPRIAVIDEEPTNLQIIKFILLEESLTCELSLYSSMTDALFQLAAAPVDLVLLGVSPRPDAGMPSLQRLTEHPQLRHTPVIVLSQTTDARMQVEAFQRGAVDFIINPIHPPVLIHRVKRVLEIRRLQQELGDRNERLERTNRQLDELLSVVSHDLLAPLSSIEIICQLLTDCIGEPGVSPVSPDMLVTRIVNQSQMARRLVQNLLNTHKLEEGVLVATPTFFNVADLLRGCTDEALAIMHAKNLRFTLHVPDAEFISFGDRDQISQALRNLLGNALKFAQTAITVTGKVFPDGPAGAPRVTITVQDDGPGIRETEQGSLFDKFATGDRRGGGNGLGLYITRKMVELQGGHIALADSGEQGTTFAIHLPHVFHMAQFPDLSDVAEARVLIISPLTASAQTMEGILVEGGMVNVDVATPDQVTAACLARACELIVLDLHQLDFNWVSLMRLLAQHAGGIPWMVLAHEADRRAIDEVAQHAMIPLRTPLDPLMFLQSVGDLLADQRMVAAQEAMVAGSRIS